MTTTLLLIRHGQTEWNNQGRYTGQSDIPLNSTGREQARRLALELGDNPPDVIVSSDLIRARETADLIAAACGLPVTSDPRLREIDQGAWEGMQFSDIKAEYGREFADRLADPLLVAPPQGETVGQVRDRVMAAVRDLLQAHGGRRVAIVAHGLVLALIKAHYGNVPVRQVWDLIPANAEAEILLVANHNRPA
jgi:alpha-ribazole phosphatase/probable phosphoglycerate mutase